MLSPFVVALALHAAPATPLRVCADPNNLPFSNAAEQGFENKIAQLLARELHTTLEYTWWAQRRGFLRNTLKAGLCDLVIGLPLGMKMAATGTPYYRSSYAFVTRADRHLRLTSLDDPRLRQLRIGVQLIGADHVNSPPAQALAERGIVQNVSGYSVVDDYAQDSPPQQVVRAVERGEVEVAIAWGPTAGYFASRSKVPLTVTPVEPAAGEPWPMTFDIAVGVRKDDAALLQKVEAALAHRHAEVERILDAYHVPRLPLPGVAR